jgi:hypothetical protein
MTLKRHAKRLLPFFHRGHSSTISTKKERRIGMRFSQKIYHRSRGRLHPSKPKPG